MNILIYIGDRSAAFNKQGNYEVIERTDWMYRLKDLDASFIVYSMNAEYQESKKPVISELNVIKHVSTYKEKHPISYMKQVSQLKRQIQADLKNVDCVMARYQGEFMWVLCAEARKQKKKVFLELGGDPWDAYWNHGLVGKLIAPLMALTCKWDIRNADYVSYVTKNYLQKQYPTKGKHIGVSNVSLKSMDDNVLSERLKKIDKHENVYHCGTAAAVNVRYKGQHFVLKALSILKQEGITNFVYHIAGMGDNTYLLGLVQEYGLQDQVIFEGVLPHEQIFSWLDGLDFYIQPSLQEGLPRALIEAMSRGCLCIGSDVAGIPELLHPYWIFNRKKRREIQIAELLKKINRDTLREQAELNFSVAKEYQFDILDQRRINFYREFVESIR